MPCHYRSRLANTEQLKHFIMTNGYIRNSMVDFVEISGSRITTTTTATATTAAATATILTINYQCLHPKVSSRQWGSRSRSVD